MSPAQSTGLAGIFTQNVGTKLISIIIALVLWVVVLGSRNFEVTKDVPLEIVTPADVVPSTDIPEKISFKLSGPKAFLRVILDRREDPIRVNLAGSKPGLVTYRFFADNIHLPIGVKVLSISPASILVKLEYMKRRDVPVKVELRGLPPEGYKIARTEVKPELVRVKGAESRVDSVSELGTLPIDVSSLRAPLERDAPLELARYGLQLDGPPPRVLIDVEPLAANFRIKNVDVRVLSSYKFTVEEKNVTVFVRASAKDLKTLDRTQVFATVDLRGKGKGQYQETVKVSVPESMGVVKVVPDKVNVTLY